MDPANAAAGHGEAMDALRDQHESELYSLTDSLSKELRDGTLDRAAKLAELTLQRMRCCRDSWDYGNAAHYSHVALGRYALSQGDLARAKEELREAGRTPGSPQLDSFGPDLVLAAEVLASGGRAEVLEYLKECRRFWRDKENHPNGELEYWIWSVKSGRNVRLGDPADLNANLDNWSAAMR